MRCLDHLLGDLEHLLEHDPMQRIREIERRVEELERSSSMAQDALSNEVAAVAQAEQNLEAKVAAVGESVTNEIQRVEAVISNLKNQTNPDQGQIDAAVVQLESVKAGLQKQVDALANSQSALDAEQAPAPSPAPQAS